MAPGSARNGATAEGDDQRNIALAGIRHPFLSAPDEIIDEARNGRMVILLDDEERENEGDLVLPGQMVTPDAINFMAKHGRGLICLALTKQRVDQLALQPMSRNNECHHETAFTTSIEAKEGVTTGISAADRARTIAVAIDAANGPEKIVSPGHVFPLVAREGGVLIRAGHTEAAVDIARLAGLNPSGVICEIMNDDGTMARRDDLIAFAKVHSLKIGTIRDLISYRRGHDRMVEKRFEGTFKSCWGGEWTAMTFYNKSAGTETLALLKGAVDSSTPTLVRMHSTSVFSDMLGEQGPRTGLLARSMEIIAAEGKGVIVIVSRPGPRVLSDLLLERSADSDKDELRDYGGGAQILTELGVQDMILLTNSHHTLVALQGYGLSIVGELPIL